jgi:hypothetical protein
MTELLVATGNELVRIRPQNDHWSAARLPCGRGMQSLAVDPGNPDVLYAGSHGEGVWKSTSRSDDWRRLEFPETDVLFTRDLFTCTKRIPFNDPNLGAWPWRLLRNRNRCSRRVMT